MDLKPCKCGREPYADSYTSGYTGRTIYYVECRPCMANATGKTEAEAVENWNGGNVEHGILDFGIEGPQGPRGLTERRNHLKTP